jgi:YHS domain-containing protein
MKIENLRPQMDALNKTSAGTAFKGFDPVAYFTESRPVYGSTEFVHTWRGVQWQFASAANRETFSGDPERYAPQYGGYCANAVSKNLVADVDPEAWKIVDDKLYLQYNKAARAEWEGEQATKISKADQYWRENENKRNDDQQKE